MGEDIVVHGNNNIYQMCLFELSDPDTGVTDLVLMLFQ
jgi:hypothetical protein